MSKVLTQAVTVNMVLFSTPPAFPCYSKSKTDGLFSFSFLAQHKLNTCTRGEKDRLGKENKKASAKIIIIILAHSCRETFLASRAHVTHTLPSLCDPTSAFQLSMGYQILCFPQSPLYASNYRLSPVIAPW